MSPSSPFPFAPGASAFDKQPPRGRCSLLGGGRRRQRQHQPAVFPCPLSALAPREPPLSCPHRSMDRPPRCGTKPLSPRGSGARGNPPCPPPSQCPASVRPTPGGSALCGPADRSPTLPCRLPCTSPPPLLRCRPAAIWMDTIPTSSSLTLSNSESIVSPRLRLGLPARRANAPATRCACGATVPLDCQDQPLTCTCLAQHRTSRHDFVKTSWRRITVQAGIHIYREVCGLRLSAVACWTVALADLCGCVSGLFVLSLDSICGCVSCGSRSSASLFFFIYLFYFIFAFGLGLFVFRRPCC
jgi:hypothetical protein